MGKKRRQRYKVHVSVKTNNPVSLMYSVGARKFVIDSHGEGITKAEAVKTVKRMRQMYPRSWNYKIKRSKK